MKHTESITKGIHRLTQEGGRTLSWSEDSGVKIIEKDGLSFKDLAKTGELLPYEDWRLSAWERACDLAKRLSIEEIAGLMLYSPHQAVPPMEVGFFSGTFEGGKSYSEAGVPPYTLSDQQNELLDKKHIRHILLAMVANADTSARWSNNLQKKAEALPFGIPVNISSDPRNGVHGGSAEYRIAGEDVSKWPEGMGFAACFDPDVVRQFAEDASREYRALGITTALGPQIDLCTEPRWMRFIDTLGQEPNAVKAMVKAYCDGMQTTLGEPEGWGRYSVNTMVKHWPGGGTGEGGRDAHYAFGAFNVYPGGQFEEHMKPFTEAAFALDGPTRQASSIMPYYSVSYGVDPCGDNVGNSYSRYIINDLLRGKCGYQGVVCTDWDITRDPLPTIEGFSSRCYGVQNISEAERHLRIIMNGVDQFGGNSEIAPVIEAYKIGCDRYGENTMRARFELSAARLLKNIFQCGLFEDPYLNPTESTAIVGCEEFVRHGYEAQKRSVVLLKNRSIKETPTLPLRRGLKLYVPNRHIRPSKSFIRSDLPAMDENPVDTALIEKYGTRVDSPEDADAAIVFVNSPQCNPYSTEDLAKGGNGYLPIMLKYRPYTADTARAVSIAGGDPREAFTNRSYRGKTNYAYNEADLDNILNTKSAMGEKPVIVVATVSNPMVMGEFESVSDAIVVEFGVSRNAVLELIFGEDHFSGRLPMQMPKDMETVEAHCEDKVLDLIPYVDDQGNAYDYGFGIKL